MTTTACPSRFASGEGTTTGAVLACRQTGEHIVHSNLPDVPDDRVQDRVCWVDGDENEFVVPCDWCRKPGATHTADEHPLPKSHPDYDAFNDATDAELTGVLLDALRNPTAMP